MLLVVIVLISDVWVLGDGDARRLVSAALLLLMEISVGLGALLDSYKLL